MRTSAELAAQDARRMALVLREVGGEGAPAGDGWMACDVVGSWARFAAGLGVTEPVDTTTLDALVDFYRSRDCRPRVQITPYQHPSLVDGLAARGFTPGNLRTVLVRSLQAIPDLDPVPSLVFRRVDSANSDDMAAWVQSQLRGDHGWDAPLGLRPITERVGRHPRARTWLLEMDGEVVGSGGLEFFEDTAVLIAACVYPEFRCRGIHGAFIQFRLAEARKEGAEVALVASVPEGPTERNAIRSGFSVAYHQQDLSQP